jgi:hypothetical protein
MGESAPVKLRVTSTNVCLVPRDPEADTGTTGSRGCSKGSPTSTDVESPFDTATNGTSTLGGGDEDSRMRDTSSIDPHNCRTYRERCHLNCATDARLACAHNSHKGPCLPYIGSYSGRGTCLAAAAVIATSSESLLHQLLSHFGLPSG